MQLLCISDLFRSHERTPGTPPHVDVGITENKRKIIGQTEGHRVLRLASHPRSLAPEGHPMMSYHGGKSWWRCGMTLGEWRMQGEDSMTV